jgi:hypothetical protein
MAQIVRQMNTHGGSTDGIPERREILLLQVFTASTCAAWHADILRRPDGPPTLAEFEPMPDADHMSGLMVDPLRDALVRIG